MKLYKAIATAAEAYRNCLKDPNQTEQRRKWTDTWEERLRHYQDLLPSGAGIDDGSQLQWETATSQKIVIHTSYHHMNDVGYYDGWTGHVVTVKPDLAHEIILTIGGRNRNDIKEYLHQVYYDSLMQEVEL